MTQSVLPAGAAGAAQTSADDPAAIMMEIAAETGLEIEELRSFRLPMKLGPWQVGEAAQGYPDYIVRWLFVGAQGERSTEGAHVPGEIRAYCVPKTRVRPAEKPGAPPERIPYVCFVILGVGTVADLRNVQARTDVMDSRETFIAELAAEFTGIGKLVGLLEDEDAVPCETCGTTNDLEDDDTAFCRGCGTKIDGDEGPDTAPPPAIPSSIS